MPMTLAGIFRYPIKGLSGEPLQRAALSTGAGLPSDRRFALAHGRAAGDRDSGGWLPKTRLLNLARHPRLARVQSRFDAASGVLTIRRGGRVVAQADLATATGATVIEQFFAALLEGEMRGAPHLLDAGEGGFWDHSEPRLSLISHASLRDLERVVGTPVHPLRFRANLYVEGAEPWAELAWAGRMLAIGDCRLRVIERIDRCAATNVDPDAGTADLNIPAALRRGYGHTDCGVYAVVVAGGTVADGATISLDGA